MNPNTSVTKTGRNSLNLFLRSGVHKVFVINDSKTHSWIDTSEYRIPPHHPNGGGVVIKRKYYILLRGTNKLH